MSLNTLPQPRLDVERFGDLEVLTDSTLAVQTGVRIAFTSRKGGISVGPYESLNLSTMVGDDEKSVLENRAILSAAMAADAKLPVIVPRQVHGTELLVVDDASPEYIVALKEKGEQGADGVIVSVCGVGAQLCFADCVPVIIVSPTGRFAVVHAGWRGVEASIAPKAVQTMAKLDQADLLASGEHNKDLQGGLSEEVISSTYNVYIGPYIHCECFETDPEVHKRFTDKFGESCAYDAQHIDLGQALRSDLSRVHISENRIADADICTVCHTDEYFSFRAAADGVCGRQGAFAYREAR